MQDILTNTTNPEDQQKVKIAFAEGLWIFVTVKSDKIRLFRFLFSGYIAAAGDPKPKDRPSLFKAVRVVVFYGILILLIMNIMSALSGGK